MVVPEQFELVRELGRGGSGVVYLVQDRNSQRQVALKVMQKQGPDAVLHLKNEYRSISDIVHPNLVEVHELHVSDEAAWLSMEYIPGTDFLSALQGQPLHVIAEAGLQTTEGLQALHQAGYLHRDLKPHNVRIHPSGRVTILDCGLAIPQRSLGRQDSIHGVVAGTLAYMPPEAFGEHEPSPARDVFSLGVMLYEVVTGKLPFEGPLHRSLLERRLGRFVPPQRHRPDLPEGLSELISSMLAPEPAGRPALDAVTAALWGLSHRTLIIPAPVQSISLIGREPELALLDAKLAAVRAGESVQLLITGPSGIGKTTLLHHFLGEQAQRDPALLVLQGRCYPSEQVVYPALDGIVDALCGVLRKLSPDELTALLPEPAPHLLQAFPVLRRIGMFKAWPEPTSAPPQVRRREAAVALRRLLASLSRRAPLVVWIDDVQWADTDSFKILGELFAEPLPVFLVLSARDGLAPEQSANLPALESMAVSKLSAEGSQTLVAALLAEFSDLGEWQEHILRAGAGVPMFIIELAQLAQHNVAYQPDEISLRQLLNARAQSISDEEWALLELVALAGGPISQALLPDSEAPLSRLRKLRLLHRPQQTSADVDVVHGWIRDAVTALIAPERQKELHRGLATRLLGADGAQLDAALYHLQRADDSAPISEIAEAAAQQATEKLALNRAVSLWELALSRCAPEDAPRLREALAEANILAGRGPAAAELLLELAREADPATAERLEVRAGEQFLLSGDYTRGRTIIFQALKRAGIRVPRSNLLAFLSMIYHRASSTKIVLDGAHSGPHDPEEARVLELGHLASLGLSVTEPVISMALQSQNLRQALQSQNPTAAARAIAMHMMMLAGYSYAPERSRELLGKACSLAEMVQRPDVWVSISVSQAATAWFEGRFADCLAAAEHAAELLAAHPRAGWQWHRTSQTLMALEGLYNTGQWAQVQDRCRAARLDAEERGETYLLSQARVRFESMCRLMDDDPAQAMESATCASTIWAVPGFEVIHLYEMLNQAEIHLYTDEPEQADAVLKRCARPLRRSMMWTIYHIAHQLERLNARILLAQALKSGSSPSRKIDAHLRKLEASPHELARANGTLLRACLLRQTASDEAAQLRYREAASAFARLGMPHLSLAARGGVQSCGGEPLDDVFASMQALGARNPAAWIHSLAPGAISHPDPESR